MSTEMRIQDALAQLAKGKFCFRSSDCIANHIAAQSQKIEALTAMNNQVRLDIMQRDLHIHLLEKEVAQLKGVMMGTFRARALISQTIATTTAAKEKFCAEALPLIEKWIAEAKAKLALFGGEAGLMVEKAWNDVQPQLREIVKSLEKLTSELFSKIKTAA